MSKQQQITIRVPEEWVARLDTIAENLSKVGFPSASRADALRFIVAKGIDPVEVELGIAKPPRAKPAK